MKKIGIVGGGISGLSLLHWLTKKVADRSDISVTLLEKDREPGGTIRSVRKDNFLFESGPNGFLDSKKSVRQLINDLALTSNVLPAESSAQLRFISVENRLHALPQKPSEFFSFSPLSIPEKLRILMEVFLPKGRCLDETVFEFGSRRFGRRFAEVFLDPMVSGIYGGDARSLNLRAAFPRIYSLEQQYGSLFKAMFHLAKERKRDQALGMPKGVLTSFKDGMSEIIFALRQLHSNHIVPDKEVQAIRFDQNQYVVTAKSSTYEFDELYLSLPAYNAAEVVEDLDREIADNLRKIHYSSIAVVGLVYKKNVFPQLPNGFGYLIPSTEKKKVLGVLFESNIFKHRATDEDVLLRIMVGGTRFPSILTDHNDEELFQIARSEVASTLGVKGDPHQRTLVKWDRAIPQYENTYVAIKDKIAKLLIRFPNLNIVANYWGGISFNDCIESAYQTAESFKL